MEINFPQLFKSMERIQN